MATKKYMSLERLTEYDELIKEKIDSGDAAVKSYVDTEVAKMASSSHNHDDRYYTESEVDTKISGVNSTISTHTDNSDIHVTTTNKSNWNSAYSHSTSAHAPSNAEKNIIVGIQKNGTDLTVNSSTRKVNITVPTTAAEIGAATSDHNHDSKYDAKGAADTALASAKEYTNTKVSGMATTTVVDNKISTHNTSASAHGDIRDLISALTTKVNNFLDVDDTTTDQLSEVLELIENNKGTLESLTSGKINTSDIVNNLTTASATKVLSANQGVVLKGLIDALQAEVDGKSGEAHTHEIANVNGLQLALDAKDVAIEAVKTEASNQDAVILLEAQQSAKTYTDTVASGKADAEHSHEIADVTGLQTALDGKAASSHGTHVSFDSTNKPKMDGTAAFGTSTKVARADHVHPTDTSRASKTEFDSHVGDTTKHITSTERTNWGAAYTHSQAAHAPSNAEKNQNAFSNVKVGETTIAADTTTDTLTLVAGSNVTITPDATNDKITISATDTVYSHPNSGVTAGTYKSVTVNAQGHVTGGSNPTTLAGYGITDAAKKTHSHAISDITNLQTTLNNASSAIVANTESIDAHTGRITVLEDKVGDGFEEITSAEIQSLFAN